VDVEQGEEEGYGEDYKEPEPEELEEGHGNSDEQPGHALTRPLLSLVPQFEQAW